MVSVRFSREASDQFIASNGTKQGFILASLLFDLYFFVMLETSFENLNESVRFEFRTRGGLFKRKSFKTRTKIFVQNVHDLLFANDCALISHTTEYTQGNTKNISRASKASFSLSA